MRPWPAQTRTTPEHPDTRLQEGQYESSVASVRDRVVQQAVKIVLEPIFEADFLPCSYGFRPKRSAHQALQAMREAVRSGRTWVVDADIEAFLDAWSHCSFADCDGLEQLVLGGGVARYAGLSCVRCG